MSWWWLLFLPAVCYQLLAITAVLRFAARRPPLTNNAALPGVSVLKPIRGLDPNTSQAFLSQVRQDYPEFEILFGVRDLNDPAVPFIRSLQRDFPNTAIRLIEVTTAAPNGKVGTLIDLSRQARYPVWVVNDSDIKVTPAYLKTVTAPLRDPAIGVVTCPYRAHAHSSATRWEAFGIAVDFIPSAMVAQQLGVRDFGLGSTLAFRADDLKAAGGFEVLSRYIADDYQLAKRIAALGKRAHLSPYVVETSLGEGSWSGMWHHQLRWAHTIRRSKGAGYAGLPLTHAGVFAAAALCCGLPVPAAFLFVVRALAALLSAIVLRSPSAAAMCWLAPAWDLFAFAIWVGAWIGDTVYWRDERLHLNPDGSIRHASLKNGTKKIG